MMIGWLVSGFGLLLSLIFVGQSEVMTAGRFGGPLRVTEGKILRHEWTSMIVNGSYVVAVHFEYTPVDTPLRGLSYTRGQPPAVGSTVVVEYAADDPHVARIRDMRSAPFPTAVAFLLIVPATGLLFLLYGLWRGLRNTHLLAHGQIAQGQLLQQAETNALLHNKRVYRVTFVFLDAWKRVFQGRARSRRSQGLADQTTEPVIYDPVSGAAVLLESIPGNACVGNDGNFERATIVEVLRVLLMPAFAGGLVWLGTRFSI